MEIGSEIDVMQRVAAIMEELDEEARRRVVVWLAGVTGTELAPDSRTTDGGTGGSLSSESSGNASVKSQIEGFTDFPELFDATGATKPHDRVLVAGYWLQFGPDGGDFTTGQVKDLLLNLGQNTKQVARDLGVLTKHNPAPVILVNQGRGKGQSGWRVNLHGKRLVETLAESGND